MTIRGGAWVMRMVRVIRIVRVAMILPTSGSFRLLPRRGSTTQGVHPFARNVTESKLSVCNVQGDPLATTAKAPLPRGPFACFDHNEKAPAFPLTG